MVTLVLFVGCGGSFFGCVFLCGVLCVVCCVLGALSCMVCVVRCMVCVVCCVLRVVCCVLCVVCGVCCVVCVVCGVYCVGCRVSLVFGQVFGVGTVWRLVLVAVCDTHLVACEIVRECVVRRLLELQCCTASQKIST